ncbi:MAG: Type 1 glutamine amidotransferase-like domain-containing protein [Patescibacteria group bacterium]|nr:Type 1 glutamine amidotransferase-like domain-containing protein [Patescibacteria group bacterium]
MKTIVLLSHSSEAQEWLNNFLHEKKVKKIAYIIDAKGPRLSVEPDYIFEDKVSFEESGFEVKSIELGALNPEEVEEKFKDCDAVFVKGGNTFWLLNAIKKSGFDKIAHKLVDKGIIYIGESAGSYVACPTIEMANWKNSDKNIIGLKDFTALGLVPFLVTAHYRKEYEHVIQPEIAKCKYEVKILTDHDLILFEEGVDKLIRLL